MSSSPITIQVSVEGPSKLTEQATLGVKKRMAREIVAILTPEIRIIQGEELEPGLAKYTTILQCDFI